MVQLDLIIPPVIVGLLIIMIFRVNAFMLETSVDTRLQTDVQMFADLAVDILQEETRTLNQIMEISGDSTSIRFVNIARDTISIKQVERALEIVHTDFNTAAKDTTNYASNLSNIRFSLETNDELVTLFLRIKVETESAPGQQALFRKEKEPMKAFAEKRLYLRNIANTVYGQQAEDDE